MTSSEPPATISLEAPTLKCPDHLEVRVSTLGPNAGMGLFLTRDLEAQTLLVEYLGETLGFREAKSRTERRYLKMVNPARHIDAVNPELSSVARYANDHPDPTRINAKFQTLAGHRVFLRTTRAVRAGEEVFVSYGRGHWLFCEDSNLAQMFLGLRLHEKGGLRARLDLPEKETVCVLTCPYWTRVFGPGLGACIELTDQPDEINCERLANPFLKGTIMIRAVKPVRSGEALKLARATTSAGVVLTGFGAFHGVDANPTESLVHVLSSEESLKSAILHAEVFRTSRRGLLEGLARVERSLSRSAQVARPVTWLHLGVFQGCGRFLLESRAHNEMDFRFPDQDGDQPRHEPIEVDQVKSRKRQTRLDLARLEQALSELGHPVGVSTDAGRFLCNLTYYTSLSRLEFREWGSFGHDESLFVHVPSFEEIPQAEQERFARDLIGLLSRPEFAPARNVRNTA